MTAGDLLALGLGIRGTPDKHGGDTAVVVRMSSDRGPVAVKRCRANMPGMLTAEAAGLQWLASHGMSTPPVLALTEAVLVTEWVDSVPATGDTARAFGGELARVHSRSAPAYGTAPTAADGTQPTAGWVGSIPMGYGAWAQWPVFYAEARLLPTAELARQRGGLSPAEHATILRLCDFLLSGAPDVGPDTGPAPIHGDLWSGNVLWTRRGATLIDPSAHGGHPETDLAMLHLFGLPHWDDFVAGYSAQRHLDVGWRRRIGMHQVFPLLVHAALFGSGYGRRAGTAAAHFLRGSGGTSRR